jgi:hypothetical protein
VRGGEPSCPSVLSPPSCVYFSRGLATIMASAYPLQQHAEQHCQHVDMQLGQQAMHLLKNAFTIVCPPGT